MIPVIAVTAAATPISASSTRTLWIRSSSHASTTAPTIPVMRPPPQDPGHGRGRRDRPTSARPTAVRQRARAAPARRAHPRARRGRSAPAHRPPAGTAGPRGRRRRGRA
ncbi:hypothetical protein ACNHYB_06965 [Isoptericola jiangsuensis]|uniref:hypothetical protein n=1 Tax=Isoptericola jiangsuensis TaxID=548579 RepID=UPI003AAE15A0